MNDIDRDKIIRKNYSSVRRINDLNGDNEIILDVNGDVVIIDESLVQAEYDAQEYARKRQPEYPPMAEQLDMQFHDAIDGTTTWQDAIRAVKNKYPKSE